jgi:hypothetical protein
MDPEEPNVDAAAPKTEAPKAEAAPVVDAAAPLNFMEAASLRRMTKPQVEKYTKGVAKEAGDIPGRDELKLILLGFGENWFTAKDALVKNSWPDGIAASAEQAPLMKELMWRLIGLRTLEFNKTLRAVRDIDLAADPAAAGKSADERLTWDYAGSDTVTSDVDVNLKGPFTHKVVGQFNKRFKEDNGWALESGTVFDVNVYALDFMHGFDFQKPDGGKIGDTEQVTDAQIVPKAEGELKDEKLVEQDNTDQEIWALVHVRRYMTEKEWEEYKKSQQDSAPDMASKLALAEARYETFHESIEQLADTMVDDATAAEAGLTDVAQAAKGHEAVVGEHRTEDAIKMAAANRLYEEKLVQIGALRDHLNTLMARKKAGEKGLDQEIEVTTLSLRSRLSESLMYANEAYTTDGGVNHVVVGMQIGGKKKAKHGIENLEVKLSDDQMLHSFHEQVGDVLKDLGHYKDDIGTASYKSGKYINRMVIAATELEATAATDYENLKSLGDLAVSLKGDASASSDLQESQCATRCAAKGWMTVGDLRAAVIRMGSEVPVLVRKAKEPEAEVELPSAEPAAPQADAAPPDASAKVASRSKLDAALASAARAVNAVIVRSRGPAKKDGGE